MGATAAYDIPVQGLGTGTYSFSFKADKSLFQAFESPEIKEGNADIEIEVERRQTLAELKVTIKGGVVVECDRCLEDLTLPVDYEGVLVVRFSEEATGYDGETMWISPSDRSVELGQYIYESIVLSLPCRRVHPDGGCNPDMLSRFEPAIEEKS